MTIRDSDIGSNNKVIWDIGISYNRLGTGEILGDRDMQHWHFFKSTCDIRTPRQGPLCSAQRLSGAHTCVDPYGDISQVKYYKASLGYDVPKGIACQLSRTP